MPAVVLRSEEFIQNLFEEQKPLRSVENPIPACMLPEKCCLTCRNFIICPTERSYGCAKGKIYATFLGYFEKCWEKIKPVRRKKSEK